MNITYTGGQESTRNDKVTVGTSNTIVSASRNGANPRKAIILRNTHPTATITINFGYQQAESGTGMVLNPKESITDSSETGYECYQGVITAISTEANGTLAVYER